MFARICFPFFDTRFVRAYADTGDYTGAPEWLVGEPPPPLAHVGGLGRVTKYIPPLPYARAEADSLVTLAPDETYESELIITKKGVDIVASQTGHARIGATFDLKHSWDLGEPEVLGEVVKTLATTEVAVRHPARRGIYETLGFAAPYLADLYARESARTAKGVSDGFQPDRVQFGRPFLILANTHRSLVEIPQTLFRVPVDHPDFRGKVWFFPWRAPSDDMAMPVWYL